MPNKCPNCARDFGIRKLGGTVLVEFFNTTGKYTKQVVSNGYYCKACNAHWSRPKNEV